MMNQLEINLLEYNIILSSMIMILAILSSFWKQKKELMTNMMSLIMMKMPLLCTKISKIIKKLLIDWIVFKNLGLLSFLKFLLKWALRKWTDMPVPLKKLLTIKLLMTLLVLLKLKLIILITQWTIFLIYQKNIIGKIYLINQSNKDNVDHVMPLLQLKCYKLD